MATAFRNFQSEIDQIHHREVNKQRAQGAAELKERETKASKSKVKEEPKQTEIQAKADQQADSAETEEKILVTSSYDMFVAFEIHIAIDITGLRKPC
jgi:folylpolyglutamate synthase/dihydropteroate synthase